MSTKGAVQVLVPVYRENTNDENLRIPRIELSHVELTNDNAKSS